MSNYRPEIWKQLCTIKSEIVESCSACRGTGYLLQPKGVHICKCMKVFKYISKLVIATIPQEYWHLSLETLEVKDVYKKAVSIFCKHLSNAVKKSLGILFMGVNGVGKTSMMCEIGKWFIVEGFSVRYFTVEEYISSLRPGGDELLAEELVTADALLIDELGKSYVKEGSSFVMDKVEHLVRSTVTKKVVIMSTNFDETDLSDFLGDSTMSVIQRHLKFIPVDGTDYSGKLQIDWKQMLQETHDYYSKNILKMADLKEERE